MPAPRNPRQQGKNSGKGRRGAARSKPLEKPGSEPRPSKKRSVKAGGKKSVRRSSGPGKPPQEADRPARPRRRPVRIKPLGMEDDGEMRLQRLLAAAGVGSRRHCEQYIVQGRVTVNGKIVRELGIRVDQEQDKVELDGMPIVPEKKVYYAVNKPSGYLCTNHDPQGRRLVIELLPKSRERLFTIGRLDESSEGLILVTNDGALANRLAHPRYRVPKTYRVQVAGAPTAETLQQLRNGVYFAEGMFKVQAVRRVRTLGKNTVLEIVLNEGQNREIRRLLAKVGHKVMKLERIAFGPIQLVRVAAGGFRPLSPPEEKLLRAVADGEEVPAPRAPRPKGHRTDK